MVTYSVSADLTAPLGVLKNSDKRRSYAMANAINTVAKRIQTAVRANVKSGFTVRRPDFIMRQAAIIKPFASGGRRELEAKVAVGQRTRLLLPDYEAGGQRKPFKGKRVAVPITGGPARPSKSSSVPASFTFRGLALVKSSRAGGRFVSDFKGSQYKSRRKRSVRGEADVKFTRKGNQWKGTHRTFVIHRSARAPHGGVYQRVGPGKDDIRLVYSFDAEVRIPPQLKFMSTAMPIARQLEREVALEVGRTFRYQLQGAR